MNTRSQSSARASTQIEDAISDLKDAMRVLGLEMVSEDDEKATDGKTHASPAFMTGYVAGSIKSAIQKLQAVQS